MFVLLLTAALAAPAQPIAPGVSVKIVDVDPQDAFSSDKATLLGLSCTAGDEGLSPKDAPGWYGGRVACANGSSYYFYKVQLSVAGAPVPPPRPPEPGGVVGGVVGPLSKLDGARAPSVAPSAPAPVAPAAVTRPTGLLHEGSKVRIVDVSPDDSYYDDRGPMIGVTCTLGSDQEDDDGWYSGSATDCSNGSSYYFYETALERVAKPAKAPKSK